MISCIVLLLREEAKKKGRLNKNVNRCFVIHMANVFESISDVNANKKKQRKSASPL